MEKLVVLDDNFYSCHFCTSVFRVITIINMLMMQIYSCNAQCVVLKVCLIVDY